MSSMFDGCESLQKLDVSNFDTSNVTDMYGMFYNCSSLQELDVVLNSSYLAMERMNKIEKI